MTKKYVDADTKVSFNYPSDWTSSTEGGGWVGRNDKITTFDNSSEYQISCIENDCIIISSSYYDAGDISTLVSLTAKEAAEKIFQPASYEPMNIQGLDAVIVRETTEVLGGPIPHATTLLIKTRDKKLVIIQMLSQSLSSEEKAIFDSIVRTVELKD